MTHHHRSTPGPNPRMNSAGDRVPERLVGLGFRCSVAELACSSEACWQAINRTYMDALGPDAGKALLLQLSQFTCSVQEAAQRQLTVNERECRGFCRDECLAISLIAACQHDVRPALRASACALTGSADIGGTLNSAQHFAEGLACAGQLLSAESVCPAACAFKLHPKRLS